MRRWSGFTIIELVVVMVIMAILLTLAGFNISSSQANARDNERNVDINTIARGLETRYKEGNPNVTAPAYVAPGSYPDITEMSHIFGNNVSGFLPNAQVVGGYSNDALPGTALQNFSPPGAASTPYAGFVIASCAGTCTVDDSATTGSTTGNAVTKGQYYYEPIDASGNICSGTACVRYNLYWHTEVDNISHILRSKHQ